MGVYKYHNYFRNETELKKIKSHYITKIIENNQKQGFQRRLNEVLETARTYVFQFRDN